MKIQTSSHQSITSLHSHSSTQSRTSADMTPTQPTPTLARTHPRDNRQNTATAHTSPGTVRSAHPIQGGRPELRTRVWSSRLQRHTRPEPLMLGKRLRGDCRPQTRADKVWRRMGGAGEDHRQNGEREAAKNRHCRQPHGDRHRTCTVDRRWRQERRRNICYKERERDSLTTGVCMRGGTQRGQSRTCTPMPLMRSRR
jgi:hypothetical protein